MLEIYRKHMRALAAHQSDDGSWRQVVDEPTSYRELTVTAMIVASHGARRHARLDRSSHVRSDDQPRLGRRRRARQRRWHREKRVLGTGAGPTKEYDLNRPEVNGADDRGGAMALLAAIEMESMRRANILKSLS